MLKLFLSLKSLICLNISKNPIGCKGIISISKGLIDSEDSSLTSLNASSCKVKSEGTRKVF